MRRWRRINTALRDTRRRVYRLVSKP